MFHTAYSTSWTFQTNDFQSVKVMSGVEHGFGYALADSGYDVWMGRIFFVKKS